MKEEPKSKKITLALFIIYLVVLTWIILFKMQFDISLLSNMKLRNINLIPFAGSLVTNGKVDISEIILNVMVFIPFGIYISMLNFRWSFLKKVLPIFCVSLLYEILQYIFVIGASDITDLIGNTLGGIIGIGVLFVFFKLLGNKAVKVFNILATIGTVIIVLFLGLLTIANM